MRGSCLCGEVQYEVGSLASPIEHCSCITCRKAHAAPFNSSASAMRDEFKWLRGESRLARYESSPGKYRYFCSGCGSHLIADFPDRSYVLVRVATLDEDPGAVPVAHIWTSHAVPWLHYGSDLDTHAEWGPDDV